MKNRKTETYAPALKKYFGTKSLSPNGNLERDGHQFDFYDPEMDIHVKIITDSGWDWTDEYEAFDGNFNALFVLDGDAFDVAEVGNDIWGMLTPPERAPYLRRLMVAGLVGDVLTYPADARGNVSIWEPLPEFTEDSDEGQA